MNEFPEKTCTADRLVTNERMTEAALTGRKTQQRREGVYAYPGETFLIGETLFECTDLKRERYGDMTDADALAEGFPNVGVYKEIIDQFHPGMTIGDAHLMWVHEFKVVDS